MFTPLAPEFSCCYGPSARSNAPHFSLILTGALKWSTARQIFGGPARLGRAVRGGIREMVAAPSLDSACPPPRACPHSRFLIFNFRFLTSGFQSRLVSCLSTLNYELSTCSLQFPLPVHSRPPPLNSRLATISFLPAPKRKSSGLKLFGMSKCTSGTQKDRLRKCLGMGALQSMRVSSPLESVFAKNLGGPPSCLQRRRIRERSGARLG
jgi:hypothetical protein